MFNNLFTFLRLCFFLSLFIFTCLMIIQGFFLVIKLIAFAAVYMLGGGIVDNGGMAL